MRSTSSCFCGGSDLELEIVAGDAAVRAPFAGRGGKDEIGEGAPVVEVLGGLAGGGFEFAAEGDWVLRGVGRACG